MIHRDQKDGGRSECRPATPRLSPTLCIMQIPRDCRSRFRPPGTAEMARLSTPKPL
ncbi:hypothetical protein Tharo_0446 [Thauera aromatica K172]|uniref:Uncharacterized protein n=1 Tax=Thauera aromatica K172 TaxID=44139 RepID=A0A2R4BJ89_THAAR|nr:hypothetical protein Tharo_0446 [Thauera aromatica K172]